MGKELLSYNLSVGILIPSIKTLKVSVRAKV